MAISPSGTDRTVIVFVLTKWPSPLMALTEKWLCVLPKVAISPHCTNRKMIVLTKVAISPCSTNRKMCVSTAVAISHYCTNRKMIVCWLKWPSPLIALTEKMIVCWQKWPSPLNWSPAWYHPMPARPTLTPRPHRAPLSRKVAAPVPPRQGRPAGDRLRGHKHQAHRHDESWCVSLSLATLLSLSLSFSVCFSLSCSFSLFFFFFLTISLEVCWDTRKKLKCISVDVEH